MTSVLELTVFDEDRDHKVEFLGRVVIPLLRIHNGEKRWYTLKDKKMYCRAKGNSPQVYITLYILTKLAYISHHPSSRMFKVPPVDTSIRSPSF